MNHTLTPDVHTPARSELDTLIEALQQEDRPTVSLYLDVHAGEDPAAPAQRANAALRSLPLERNVRTDVERSLRESLRHQAEGYLAWFLPIAKSASFHAITLRQAPPLPGGHHEAVARYGTPWREPLELHRATHPPIVAVYADARRARVFVHDLGELHEVASYVRALDPTTWRRYAEHSTGMPGRPARGGTGRDDVSRRTEVWSERFVRDVMTQIDLAVRQREGTRLALLGEPQSIVRLEAALNAALAPHVLLRGSLAADPDLDATHLAEPLATRIGEALALEETALVHHVQRDGVHGLGPTLHALTDGDLAELVLANDMDVGVVHCLGTQWIAESEEAARRVCPDGAIEHAPLKTFARTLAKRHATKLRIVHGDAAQLLVDAMDGVAGSLRANHR